MPLTITVPPREFYDEKSGRFMNVEKEHKIVLEHSLVSISKWESKWHVPFLSDKSKTLEQSIDYIKCMTLTQNVDPLVYLCLTNDNFKEINEYIENPMTASSVTDRGGKKSREIVTSELIYYWMIANEVPMECQKWHLNRLLMLIRICSAKNQPNKKMSKGEIMRQNHALNQARRKASGSRG